MSSNRLRIATAVHGEPFRDADGPNEMRCYINTTSLPFVYVTRACVRVDQWHNVKLGGPRAHEFEAFFNVKIKMIL